MSVEDQAVSPEALTTQPTQEQNTAEGTGGTFSTTNPSIPSTPIAQPNPIQKPPPPPAQAQNSGSGASGIGGIIGGLASLASFLFSSGGFVGDGKNGYAAGGSVGEQDPHKGAAFAEGYLVGAHHQQNYGGTPDTLQKAAMEIKQMLTDKLGGKQGQSIGNTADKYGFTAEAANPGNSSVIQSSDQHSNMMPHMASGGSVNADQQLVTQAIQQSLGLTPDQQKAATANPVNANTVAPQQTQPTISNQQNQQQNPQQYIEPPPAPVQTTQPPQVDQNNPNGVQSQQTPQQGFMDNVAQMLPPPQTAARGGYMQPHLAMGGPPQPMPPQGAPMPQGQQPLKPGQMFQGDGSVKGPGGPQDDAIPAKLSNGEFVFSQPAVQFFGVDKLVKMNEQGKQGFMQALGQVQQNQAQSQQGAPQAPQQQPPMPPQGQPPQPQAKGGLMKPRGNNGFAGL